MSWFPISSQKRLDHGYYYLVNKEYSDKLKLFLLFRCQQPLRLCHATGKTQNIVCHMIVNILFVLPVPAIFRLQVAH